MSVSPCIDEIFTKFSDRTYPYATFKFAKGLTILSNERVCPVSEVIGTAFLRLSNLMQLDF